MDQQLKEIYETLGYPPVKEIVVYFNSGNKARLPADKTVFATDPHAAGLLPMVVDGHWVVNWANVCFVRAFEEREVEE